MDLKALGKSLLISTHMLDTAQNLCDRVLVMKSGKLIAEGTIDDLRKRVQAAQESTLEELFLEITSDENKVIFSAVSELSIFWIPRSTKTMLSMLFTIRQSSQVWLFNTACSSYGSCLFCLREAILWNRHGI